MYPLLIRIASIWNDKADSWIRGRVDLSGLVKASSAIAGNSTIWVHTASSGEYLQILPVMKAYKSRFPETKYLLTFFSPSGYNQWEKKSFADAVGYLPWETSQNIGTLIDHIDPKMVWVVKNEFWFKFLKVLQTRNVDTFFISTKIRNGTHITLPYFKEVLKGVKHFFVQDETSKIVFAKIGIQQVTVTGDSRVDHVLSLTKEKLTFPRIEALINEKKNVFIYGSIYKEDIPAIKPLIESNPQDLHLLVPHDVSQSNVEHIINKLDFKASRYSSSKILVSPVVIDELGILNKLYRYANCVYIGGGFNQGIHNTLEPVVYGIPIIFGPNYEKFQEAVDFIKLGIAKSISGYEDVLMAVDNLLKDKIQIKTKSEEYFKVHKGATNLILKEIIKSDT